MLYRNVSGFVSPLQGSGCFPNFTRAFSPGFNITGFQSCDLDCMFASERLNIEHPTSNELCRKLFKLHKNWASADWQSAIQQAGSVRYERIGGFCRAHPTSNIQHPTSNIQ
jgi:hypothetical protein